jgi:phosphonate transport system substrate-binding protein
MRRRRVVGGAVMAAGTFGLRPTFAATRLRVGLTAVILADQAAFLSRWGAYLTRRIGCDVSFSARDSYQVIEDMLAADQIDLAWVCGYPYVQHEAAWRLVAVPLFRGQPLYQAYLIRPNTSKRPVISGWGDLRGKVLAYSDPLSNSGWLVAQEQLATVGIHNRDLARAFFAHGHRNVAEAVAAQLADAGSIDGYVWETMREQRMSAALGTKVVWKSPLHGFPPIVAKRSASHPYLSAFGEALLSMPEDPEGKQLLVALNLTGFVRGDAGIFDSIHALASRYGSGVVA